MTGDELHVLVARQGSGAGYRLISARSRPTAAAAIMVDRGFVPAEGEGCRARRRGLPRVTGNLHWPEETDGFTPAPDRDRNIWFARDVAAMADALGTEPVLVVARAADGRAGGAITRCRWTPRGIPNDHLQYAITWFSLAADLGWR